MPLPTTFARRWEDVVETRDERRDTSLAELGETIALGQIDILPLPGANGDAAEIAFPEDDDDDFE